MGDLWVPVLGGGQDLRSAMAALGVRPSAGSPPRHVVGEPRRRELLGEYARKRDFSRTSEPSPAAAQAAQAGEAGSRFVIQHHLARRLHHDLRLEHQGAAVSWAIPKGLPDVPGLRHLAVQTEDHPLEYLSFSGDIPAGEYGAGAMRIWDEGTYEVLEWQADKVTFVLDGRRHRGQWHLFRTGGDQWLVARAGEPDVLVPPPPQFSPMLAVDGGEPFDDDGWLFEVKWDGIRAVARTVRPGAGDDGSTALCSRLGNDLTPAYPELASLWERVLARNAVFDGEIVALGSDGLPSFQVLQHRMHLRESGVVERAARATPVTYVVFDVLAVDGEAVVERPLCERVELLAEVLVPGGPVQRSEPVRGEGLALFEAARRQGLEGVIAKRVDSVYRPGQRSRDWVKVKARRDLHVVIGGWLVGQGSRGGQIGSLLAGLYDGDRLRFVGKVGTGFDDAELAYLAGQLAPLEAGSSPFADPAGLPPEVRRGGRWVQPRLVCRVEFNDVTEDVRLRGASYKGLVDRVPPHACTLDQVS